MIEFERVTEENTEESNIVLGMIVSTDFIRSIEKTYKPEFFSQFYTRTVAEWCMEYYQKYEKAPYTVIKSVFESNKIKIPDQEKIETISIFLDQINDKFVEENRNYNLQYNTDQAIKFFKGASLLHLEEKIKGFRLRGEYDLAEEAITDYARVEKNIHSGVDVFSDKNEMEEALKTAEEDNYLFPFPGELNKLFRPIQREDFFAFAGPAARKKSFMLMEMAFTSLIYGNNTILFLFELPKRDFLKRMAKRITGMVDTFTEDSAVGVDIPFFDHNYESNKVVHQRKELRKPLSISATLKKMEAVKTFVKGKKLKIEYAPEKTVSVKGVQAILKNLERFENWKPDVIITDYADAMAADYRGSEVRHKIDEIWTGHRSLSQYWNAAVITGTHTKVQTLERDIKQADLSEDYRKLNHVTGAVGLNQTEEEEDAGILRLNVLKDTRARAKRSYEAVVLQCLDIGQVILDCRVIKKEGK